MRKEERRKEERRKEERRKEERRKEERRKEERRKEESEEESKRGGRRSYVRRGEPYSFCHRSQRRRCCLSCRSRCPGDG